MAEAFANLPEKLLSVPACTGWYTIGINRRRRPQLDRTIGGDGDLGSPVGTEIGAKPPLDLHFGRNPTPKSLARYRAVPPGGNRFDLQKNAPHLMPPCWIKKASGGTDLFDRLWWNRPSVTIRTEFFKPEKGRYLHPSQHRPITHREAARLMGFPDDFVFKGTKTEIARQIGNAVPPDLGGAVATVAKQFLHALSPEIPKSKTKANTVGATPTNRMVIRVRPSVAAR